MSGTTPSDRRTPIDDPTGRIVDYDDRTDTYRAWASEHDHEPISTVVVLAVAAVRGVDSGSLPLLSTQVDPDALDAIFADRYNGVPRTDAGSVSFPFVGCDVTVRSGGEVVVDPPADHDPAR